MKITKQFLEDLIKNEIMHTNARGNKIIAQSIEDSLNGITRGNLRRQGRVKKIIDEETMKELAEAHGSGDDPERRYPVRPPWSRESTEHAKDLAQPGVTQAAEETRGNAGLFDGMLEDGTPVADVLNQVRQALNLPGGRPVLEKFDQFLFEMGVDLGEPPRHEYEGPERSADDMEDSLGRFQDKADKAAWTNKQRFKSGVPRGEK